MATYTNQIPSTIRGGDVLRFNGAYGPKSFTLPAGNYDVIVAGGGGGDGGGAYATTYGTEGEASSQTYGGNGGRGGFGALIEFTISLAAATSCSVTAGAMGTDGSSVTLPGIYGQPNSAAGTAGSRGQDSRIVIGTQSSTAGGGGGGGGGSVVATVGGGGADGEDGVAGTASGNWPRTGYNNIPSGYYFIPASTANGYVQITALNSPPTTPLYLNYGQPFSGQPCDVTYGGASDPDGGAITYQLERQVTGGSWTQVCSGAAQTYADTVPTAGSPAQIRWQVRAQDTAGTYSSYLTGPWRDISYNHAPTITDTTASAVTTAIAAGVTAAPVLTYTVADADTTDTLTAVEKRGSTTVRSFVATRAETNTVDMTGWVALPAGTYTFTATVGDGNGGSAAKTWTVVKVSSSIRAQRVTRTSAQPLACSVYASPVPSEWPTDATVKVYASNNPYDDTPVWEDITDKVDDGATHTFANTTTTETDYGFALALEGDEGASGEAVAFEMFSITLYAAAPAAAE